MSVMTLEEYEPNREFVGRNFNAGEVIQLVLRSPRTGRWLPFEYVQMVMMHELAHCKQMNHSRAFWAVRNQYAAQMNELWREGYTGEGIWGRGASLATGEWERNQVRDDEVLPEHLCGGTYRSRRRKKRKVKPVATYQERKERRILKKFGKNGVTLGGDVEARARLEKGKRVKATPRVANSIRGRELRAAAAMARMEQEKAERQKIEEQEVVKDEDETESGSESEFEDGEGGVEAIDAAVDVDGTKMLDTKGRGMVKVCEDEDTSDPDAQNELSQLAGMFKGIKSEEPATTSSQTIRIKRELVMDEIREPLSITAKEEPIDHAPQLDNIPSAQPQTKAPARSTKQQGNASSSSQQIFSQPNASTCSICSFVNPPSGVTCTMCANVLNPTLTPNTWRCTSSTCMNTHYVNSGDCGVCGLCGQRRN